MPHDGTGTGWNVAEPSNSALLSTFPIECRDLRIGVALRINKEHGTLAGSSAGGEHKKGSARAYYGTSTPTQQPDAATSLSASDDGRLSFHSTNRILSIYTGSAFTPVKPGSFAVVTETKAQGTAGGTLTASTWTTRALNTEVVDGDSIVSLSGSQFTLGAGTYRIRAAAPAYKVNTHRIRLYDITNGAVAAYGTVGYSGADVEAHSPSILSFELTISGNTVYEIQHYAQTTKASNGAGEKSNITGVTETYTIVEITKV